MGLRRISWNRVLRASLFACACALVVQGADAATCKTESQLSPAERDALSNSTRSLIRAVQSGDVQNLQANTIPQVASDFGGIASSVQTLKPLVQQATMTIFNLYFLDASTEAPNTPRTDFYCGTPVVVMNFNGLPRGTYALALVHATGVPQPQQISLVLANNANRWMLAGFFAKPMLDAGHNGLWYWTSARSYAQKKMNWDAWFYYHMAASLLEPVDFITSANLQKLQHETDQVHPDNLPAAKPLMLTANGSTYEVTGIDTSSALGSQLQRQPRTGDSVARSANGAQAGAGCNDIPSGVASRVARCLPWHLGARQPGTGIVVFAGIADGSDRRSAGAGIDFFFHGQVSTESK
jgi:hypothetical protein